ncbi:MAG: ASCH domain-containing protein [Candidatus Baldrarchaeia archaeon]
MRDHSKGKKFKRLSFDKKYAIDILLGIKRATIRKTDKGLNPGDVVEFYTRGPRGRLIGWGKIRKIVKKKVSELSDRDVMLEGFSQRECLLAALSTHYKGIQEGDEVVVIEFELERPSISFSKEVFSKIAKLALDKNLELSQSDQKLLEYFLRTPKKDKIILSTDLRNIIRKIYIKFKSDLLFSTQFHNSIP